MKKIIIALNLICFSILPAFSQHEQHHKSNVVASDTTKSHHLPLLSHYYGIKDALVAGNVAGASAHANEFIKSANGIDYKVISEGNINTLLKDAGTIAGSKEIKKQREVFANLSANMIEVAKAISLSAAPVYQQYCPMKKASWLSSEKEIKNPYYGKAMLNCGEVVEIFQPTK